MASANTYVTRTAELGRIEFRAPAADEGYAGYVWISTDKSWMAKGCRQICYGGGFTGNTVRATTASLKSEAQKWLRARRRGLWF